MSGKVHAVNVSAGPVPSLTINMDLENSHNKSIIVMVMDITISFSPSNVEFKMMEIPNHLEILERNSSSHVFNVQIPKHIFDIIEKHREYDVNMGIRINSLAKDDDGEFQTVWMGGDHKFSQKEWTDLLEKIGYHKQWIVEIPRPEILPFKDVEKVEKELTAAHQLLSKGEYPDVITRCRKALEALAKLIEANKDRVTMEIDKGSSGESDEVTKSHRYESILKAIQKANQIGPHTGYFVFKEDAEALIHMTTALVGYYSKMLSKSS